MSGCFFLKHGVYFQLEGQGQETSTLVDKGTDDDSQNNTSYNCASARHWKYETNLGHREPLVQNYTFENRLKLLNLPFLELSRLCNDLAWCYKIVFALTVLKFDDVLWAEVGTLPCGHKAFPSKSRSEAFELDKRNCMYKSRAVAFSERVWTNCLSLLVLVSYRYSFAMCTALIYLAMCICNVMFCLFVGQLSVDSVTCCPVFWQIKMTKVIKMLD